MKRLLLLALCACAHSERIQTNSAETVRTTETREEGPETITTTTEEFEDGSTSVVAPPAAGSLGGAPQLAAVKYLERGPGRILLKRTVVVDQRSPASTVTTTADDTTVKTDSKTETRVGPGLRFYLFLLVILCCGAAGAFCAHRWLKVWP